MCLVTVGLHHLAKVHKDVVPVGNNLSFLLTFVFEVVFIILVGAVLRLCLMK